MSIFANLTPWQITQLARHPHRPYTLDYVNAICSEFHELHGDRMYADDGAIVGGLARLDERALMVIGHQKGRDTKERVRRNYGMPKPEGYRKALRLMRLAERFGLPLVTLIDTQGAYPGVGAEERGQSEAIARNLFEMSVLRIPIVSVVTGEGGSGGALGIGVCDRLLMLQYSTYSVISPEGLRLDPVEEPGQERGGGRGAEPHRRPPAQARARRRGHRGAARRRAPRCGGHGRQSQGRPSSASSTSWKRFRATSCAPRARRRSPASACIPKTPPEARRWHARAAHLRASVRAGCRSASRSCCPSSRTCHCASPSAAALDSTALLAALARMPRRPRNLRALHVDHGLQPRSRLWSAHCRRIARALGVPLAVRRARVPRRRGESLEAPRARRATGCSARRSRPGRYCSPPITWTISSRPCCCSCCAVPASPGSPPCRRWRRSRAACWCDRCCR